MLFRSYFGCDRFEVMSLRLGLEWKGPFPPNLEDKDLLTPPPQSYKEVEHIEAVEAVKALAKEDLELMFKGVPKSADPNEEPSEKR